MQDFIPVINRIFSFRFRWSFFHDPGFTRLFPAMVMLSVWFFNSLPDPLFHTTYSTVLVDEDDRLLSARVAADEQWRFPMSDSLPDKYVAALILAEDRHFLSHQGVYLPSLVKAFWDNIKSGKIRRGGSTITMQVIRLSQNNPPRTLPVKLAEILLAYRLELSFSKEDILRMYAAHAPFGSNVIGLEAASWRYFGKSSNMLSWAESATLAVLPNSPGLIYPGRNAGELLKKRNRLLRLLNCYGRISDEACELAMAEPLPVAPEPIPDLAPHLLTHLIKEGYRGKICRTTLQIKLQEMVTEIAARHHQQLAASSVHNLAVLVLDTRTGSTLAYVGNAPGAGMEHGEDVDIIPSRRSSGSILKPFLYAMMLDDGLILPNMLVQDIPVEIGNFRPLNYSKAYSGAIPARMALARSLNIPAVLMLRDYSTARFCDRMRKMGMSTLEKPASHYGLSVILGGAETRLWELCGFYGSMGRVLLTYSETDGRYRKEDIHPPVLMRDDLVKQQESKPKTLKSPEMFHAGSVWLTFEAMKEVARPDEEANWFWFSSMPVIAWKTGTSFGNRDAWAVGVSPRYVVGVWVGNANGEGRPNLTGTSSAAPVLFDIFSRLPRSRWFETPWDNLTPVEICRQSGHPAGPYCTEKDTVYVQDVILRMPVCPYHQVVHLDKEGKYRVNASCVSPSEMVHKSWFILPPLIEYYFKPQNPSYRSLPPLREDCRSELPGRPVMEVVYPVDMGEIIIPVDISGKKEKVIFEVAHQEKNSTIFWYLDETFIGTTAIVHKLSLCPGPGWHTLTLTDQLGNMVKRRFKVADNKKGG
jgi:penicillin-binding protein 1C